MNKESRFKKHNKGKRNFSSSMHRNFIFKSDIFKLKENTNTTGRIITPKKKKINELNNNRFYNYFCNNNVTKNNNSVINNISNQNNEIKNNNNSRIINLITLVFLKPTI